MEKNKVIVLLLAIAMLTSITTTMVTLNSMTSLTGLITSNLSTTVDLSVSPVLSITLSDAIIDFGVCSLDADADFTIFDSNQSSSAVNNSLCSGTFPDNITIENDGNVDVNVSLRTSANGSVLFNNNYSGLAYMVRTDSGDGGCFGTFQATYLNFTNTAINYTICTNLTFIDTADTVEVFALAQINSSASGGGTASLTFEAQNII